MPAGGQRAAVILAAAGIPLDLASHSRPERLVMTPVALILFVCCLLIALQ